MGKKVLVLLVGKLGCLLSESAWLEQAKGVCQNFIPQTPPFEQVLLKKAQLKEILVPSPPV